MVQTNLLPQWFLSVSLLISKVTRWHYGPMMGPSRETIGVNFNVELVLSYVEEKVCGVQVKDPGDSRKPRS